MPKRMSEDSLRQPLGSPRDAFGSILGVKMVPKSELDDFEDFLSVWGSSITSHAMLVLYDVVWNGFAMK